MGTVPRQYRGTVPFGSGMPEDDSRGPPQGPGEETASLPGRINNDGVPGRPVTSRRRGAGSQPARSKLSTLSGWGELRFYGELAVLSGWVGI